MNHEATLSYARGRDEADPLRRFRERFALPTGNGSEPLVYLCGHSLGLMPLEARRRIEQELDDWARLGVLGHEHALRPWLTYHEQLTAGLAYLAGAQSDEVVAMSSLTVNLHLMLATFYQPQGRRVKVLMEAGAFSSDRHAVASQLAWHGLDPQSALLEISPPAGSATVSESDVEGYLERHGADIALVLWPGVQFRTGQAFDLRRIVHAAHRAGCLAGLDLAHSIGNTPLALHQHEADFAVWCSYKYLNAGPGAIGGCFVHQRHANLAGTPRLAGWWGHDSATRFQMGPHFSAQHGAAGWQISNPPILSAAPLTASLEIFQEARIERLREKSLALTGYLEYLLQPQTPAIEILTPSEPQARGCQLSLRIRAAGRGRKVFDRLQELGVVCDWREPDVLRVAPVPLYNRFEDVYRLHERLQRALPEAG
jgi:kynureninase